MLKPGDLRAETILNDGQTNCITSTEQTIMKVVLSMLGLFMLGLFTPVTIHRGTPALRRPQVGTGIIEALCSTQRWKSGIKAGL